MLECAIEYAMEFAITTLFGGYNMVDRKYEWSGLQ